MVPPATVARSLLETCDSSELVLLCGSGTPADSQIWDSTEIYCTGSESLCFMSGYRGQLCGPEGNRGHHSGKPGNIRCSDFDIKDQQQVWQYHHQIDRNLCSFHPPPLSIVGAYCYQARAEVRSWPLLVSHCQYILRSCVVLEL